jgi:DNA ligase-1
MRGQLIKRKDDVFLWSRGQELITDTFPEVSEAGAQLPNGTVLDGELLAWKDGRPMPFYKLQERIGRKNVPNDLLEEVPVQFFAYDLLETGGEDIRDEPIENRRDALESVSLPDRFHLSELVTAESWDDYAKKRGDARDKRVEGLMLKRKGSPYRTGRKRGDWWKWKVDPYTIDAVLMYAKAGHGKRANLYSDMTFGVWRDDEVVPIAKAYSGLTDEQLSTLDDWIKSNTLERYGPVRAVEFEHVFEIAFSGLAPSNRHKSGISLRFPRINRWRKDKSPEDANTLEDVQAILDAYRS